ncbi:hypothetical protein CANCADRAFT_130163 [Tortispora caseinolytica NRRL Y-17796]|uniref:Nucleoporin POM33 n=1 Tax=Tortispora caseinolytica NRRL Y-17796 TaxID=767744 RepID=A0A1E4TAS2_9ASCO|nr:hypothetical protein CANCADRAFT_130163 [Tortispora caseinolytica NRRL Y-17796]
MSSKSGSNAKKQSLGELVKTIQFAWFVGHVVSLLGFVLYFISVFRIRSSSRLPLIWYRMDLLGAIATFGIVLATSYTKLDPRKIVRDDNFQYLLVSILWWFQSPSILVLIPFACFSIFHVLSFTRTTLLPTLGTPATSPIGTKIAEFVKGYNDRSLAIASTIEILVLIRCILSALMFRRGSWITMVLYSVFIKVRYDNSHLTRASVRNMEVRIDSLLADARIPPSIRNVWNSFKASLRKYHNIFEAKIANKPAAAAAASKKE